MFVNREWKIYFAHGNFDLNMVWPEVQVEISGILLFLHR